MEPIEARIGNYVLVPETDSKVLIPSVPKQVLGITTQGEFEVAVGHFDITIKIPAKHCKGIQLRNAHLEFIGFRKLNEHQYIHKVLDILLEDYNEFFNWTLTKNLIIKIDYVHQIQNLFADMTTNSFVPEFSSYFKQKKEIEQLHV